LGIRGGNMKGSINLNLNLGSKIIFFIIVTNVLLVGCSDESKLSKKATTVVFQNVNLITMTEDKVLENQSVVVKDGLITEIGEFQTVNIPKDAQIINGEGKYLMPGLVDMHVHLWRYGREEMLYLANGVTTIQNLWGFLDDLKKRDAINDRKIVAPRMFTTGPIMDGPNPIWKDSLVLESPEEAREEARGIFLNQSTDSYLIFLENKYVGIIDFLKNNSKDSCPWIGLLMIHGDYHSIGYGKKAYVAFEEKLKRQNFNNIRIGILQENLIAKKYWTSLGFKFYKNSEWEGKLIECFEKQLT